MVMRMMVLALPSGVSKALEIARAFSELGIEVHTITQMFDSKELNKVLSSWTSLDFVVCISSVSMCVHVLKDVAKMPYDPGVVAVSPKGSVAIPIMNCGIGGARALCRYLERINLVDRCIDTFLLHEQGFVNLNELPFILRMETVERWRRIHDILIEIDRGSRVRLYAHGRMLKVVKEIKLPPNVEIVGEPHEVDVCIVHALEGTDSASGECCIMMRARPLALSVCVRSDFDDSDLLKELTKLTTFFGLPMKRIDYALTNSDRVANILREQGIVNVAKLDGNDAVEILRKRWKKIDVLLHTSSKSITVALAEIGGVI